MPFFGFRFSEAPPFQPATLHAVGKARETSVSYRINGLERKINTELFVFQYTLSGKGLLRIENTTHVLEHGTAFLVKVPGDHQYELPEDGTEWEFIYIALTGEKMAEVWRYMMETFGPVPYFHEESSLIYLLKKIYRQAENKQIIDGYQASALAYQFVTELYRAANRRQHAPADWPDSIARAADYIQENFPSIRGLEEVSTEVGLSKFHFIRLFHRTTGMTPIQFLTKIRLEKAMGLLKDDKLTLNEIAEHVGLSDGNYLSRAFRKYIGMSPGQFRSGRAYLPLDHITFD